MKSARSMLLFIFLSLAVSGCAGRQKALLEQDYLHMTNDELLLYHDNLSVQIADCVRERDRASVGVGTGYGSGGVGVFLGLSRGISTCDPQELIKRRNEVKEEMKRRGFNP